MLAVVVVGTTVSQGFGCQLDASATQRSRTGPAGFKKPLISRQGQFLKPNRQLTGVFIVQVAILLIASIQFVKLNWQLAGVNAA
jgi:hypothetical protein